MILAPLASPPAKLIDESGNPNFGVFNGPISDLNLDDFDYRQVTGFPWRMSRNGSKIAKKRWQYLGAFDEQVVLGVAVVHLSYIGSAFAYVYNRGTGSLKEFNLLDPAAQKTIYSKSSIQDYSRLKTAGSDIRLDNDVNAGPRRIFVDSPGLKINVEVPDSEKTFSPLSICVRNGLHGFNYTHKAAGLPAKGWLEVDGQRIDLAEDALAVLDWTAGCAARQTHWNWASAAGRLGNSKVLGLNLVMGVNDSGHTENVLWLDGVPTKVDVVHFDYNHKNVMAPWRITSNDGKVDLHFAPEGERKENKNFLIVASKFRQPFGVFSGKVKIGGRNMKVDSLYGFVEEHFVRW